MTENPEELEHQPEDEASRALSYLSIPSLATSVILSMILLAGALFLWYALGPEVRAQVTMPQAATLLFFVMFMLAAMLLIGYSHLWAADGEVVIRNGPFMRRHKVEDIAGLRLRKGDPWAYLLVKDPKAEGGLHKYGVLAIQSLEGKAAGKKVRQLRRWLKANGATSEGIPKGPDPLT